MDELLDTAQAAKLLGVSVMRVRQWIAENRLPAQQISGRHVLRASDVAAGVPRKTGGWPAGRPRAKETER